VLEQQIALVVAERIVKRLEIIEIDEEQRSDAAARCERAFQALQQQ